MGLGSKVIGLLMVLVMILDLYEGGISKFPISYMFQECDYYEYCPNCEANLTLQDGYSPDLSHWTCKGCGMLLVNPEVPGDSDVFWFCDQCGALLNEQSGFAEESGEWICIECGFPNKINPDEVYAAMAEY